MGFLKNTIKITLT